MRGVTGAVGLAWRAAVHGWGPSRNQRGWQGCRQPSCLRQPHHTRGPQSSSLGCSNAMTGGVEGGDTLGHWPSQRCPQQLCLPPPQLH